MHTSPPTIICEFPIVVCRKCRRSIYPIILWLVRGWLLVVGGGSGLLSVLTDSNYKRTSKYYYCMLVPAPLLQTEICYHSTANTHILMLLNHISGGAWRRHQPARKQSKNRQEPKLSSQYYYYSGDRGEEDSEEERVFSC